MIYDNISSPPQFSQSGNYIVQNSVIESVFALLITSGQSSLEVYHCTFYKCKANNNLEGGAISFLSKQSLFKCVNSCFNSNMIPYDDGCGFAIRLHRTSSPKIAIISRITTCDHVNEKDKLRDTISFEQGPEYITEWNSTNNHLNFRSLLFIRVSTYEQSYVRFMNAFNNSDIREHMICTTDLKTLDISFFNLIQNHGECFLYTEVNPTNIFNCYIASNTFNNFCSGIINFIDCLFNQMFSYSNNVQFLDISGYSNITFFFLSTYLCESLPIISTRNASCIMHIASLIRFKYFFPCLLILIFS